MTDEGMQEADSDPKEMCKGGCLSRMLLSLPKKLLLEKENQTD